MLRNSAPWQHRSRERHGTSSLPDLSSAARLGRHPGTSSLPDLSSAAQLGRHDALRAAVALSLRPAGIGTPGRARRRGAGPLAAREARGPLAGWRPTALPSLAEVFPAEFPDADISDLGTTGTANQRTDAVAKMEEARGGQDSCRGGALDLRWQSNFRDLQQVSAQRVHEEVAAREAYEKRLQDGIARCKAAEEVLCKALGADDEEVSSPAQSQKKAMALRPALCEARDALRVSGVPPPGTLRGLNRAITLATMWLEQWDAHEVKRRSEHEHAQRVRRGEASDWQMTQEELEDRVIAGDLGAVRAGVRAKLSVLRRSERRRRRTLVHLACERLGCEEVVASQHLASAYLKIVETLLQAGAGGNSVDDDDYAPLDLALPGASWAIQDALQKLGLRQRKERLFTVLAKASTDKEVPVTSPPPVPAEEVVQCREDVNAVDSSDAETEPGPLAQFLATGALLRSQSGWRGFNASTDLKQRTLGDGWLSKNGV